MANSLKPAYPFDCNWTEQELMDRRKATIESELTHPAYETLTASQKMLRVSNFEFTCDNCPNKSVCDLVFDPYNTNGDCLAEK